MTNNDILRHLRYIFDYDDSRMIEIFSFAAYQVNRSQICDWLKKDKDPTFLSLEDIQLAAFLNGFIIEKRGKKEGDQPKTESRLNNNVIFRKLRIALKLSDEEIIEILKLADRACNDQFLRNFLHGLEIKFRNLKN